MPVRGALLQLCSDALLKRAAGDLRLPLWGAGDHAPTLAGLMLLIDVEAKA